MTSEEIQKRLDELEKRLKDPSNKPGEDELKRIYNEQDQLEQQKQEKMFIPEVFFIQ